VMLREPSSASFRKSVMVLDVKLTQAEGLLILVQVGRVVVVVCGGRWSVAARVKLLLGYSQRLLPLAYNTMSPRTVTG
jgi:hypothetical protein